MKLKSVWFVVLALCLFVSSEASLAWLKIGLNLIICFDKIWQVVERRMNDGNSPWPEFLDRGSSQMARQIMSVSDDIENLSKQLDVVESKMTNIINNIPDAVGLEIKRHELQNFLAIIGNNYGRMFRYMQNTSEYEKATLMDFARNTVSHDAHSVYSIIERLYGLLLSRGESIADGGIIPYLVKSLNNKESTLLCNMNQSPQQVIQILYDTLGAAALKSYAMIQFSYVLLKMNGEGNFTKESKNLNQAFQWNINQTVDVVGDVMQRVSAELWICDPRHHVAGRTYTELTQLLQGYIQNEVDLNEDGTCWSNCAAYQSTKRHSCYQKLFCDKQKTCNGKITNCKFVASTAKACLAAYGSHRRYHYIAYENDVLYGRKTESCPGGFWDVDSWWRWVFYHCSYCMCLCDEQGRNSDRYFSLRGVESNTTYNRVVTGMRFIKSNRIIHIQVQEGKLLAGGTIDPNIVHWVPLKDYKLTDRGVYNGKDFHTLTQASRTLDLDDLKGEYNEVLTGVRLDLEGSHLKLAIRLHRFDYETGELSKNFAWKTPDGTCSNLNQIKLEDLDVATRSSGRSLPDSRSGQCIRFTNSGFKQDAAQTTVPFLDIQPVASSAPMPLSGAGIYHKGSSGYAGFVAPRLLTFDYTRFLKVTNK